MPHIPIISADPQGDFETAINRASKVLLSGGLVAFPTESFYGLAVDATNETAVKRLFSVKERKRRRPVLILIPSLDSLAQYVKCIPKNAHALIKEFWPGGLTLVFDSAPKISQLLTGETGKIGIRLSSNTVATALTSVAGVPITGTSANLSGQPPCRNAEGVMRCFGQEVDLILDGGETQGETASTVLDVTLDPPRILREGLVEKTQLEKFWRGQG